MWVDHAIIVLLGQIWHYIAIRTECLLRDLKLVICIERYIIFDIYSLVNSPALCPRGIPDPPGWSPSCWAHCSSLFPLHLSLTANSPAEPSKDLHKRRAVPVAASFPAGTSCLANPDGSAVKPLGPVSKTALGPALFVASKIHVRRGGEGRGCPPYAVTQPGATSSVKILLSGAQGHPNVFLRLHAMSRLVQQVSCGHFFPLNLSSSELFLGTLTLYCGLVHKTTSFQGKWMSTMVCFTLIIGRLFLSKEDLASWKSPLRGIHYINSLLHPVIYVCFYY